MVAQTTFHSVECVFGPYGQLYISSYSLLLYLLIFKHLQQKICIILNSSCVEQREHLSL